MVYLIKRSGSKLCKLGHSINVERRIKELQTANAEELILIEQWEGGRELEKKIHDKLRVSIKGRQSKVGRGEWFYIEDEWINVILFEINHKLVATL